MYSSLEKIKNDFFDGKISINTASKYAREMLIKYDLSTLSKKELIDFSNYCDFFEPGFVINAIMQSPMIEKKQELIDILNNEFQLRDKMFKSAYNLIELVLSGKKTDQRDFFYNISEWNYNFGLYNAQLKTYGIDNDIGAGGQVELGLLGFLKYCTSFDHDKFKHYNPDCEDELAQQVKETWGSCGAVSAGFASATVISTIITRSTSIDDSALDERPVSRFDSSATAQEIEHHLYFLSDHFKIYSESTQIESYKKTPLYEAAVQNNFVDIKKILLNPQDPKNGIFELFWFIKEGNIQGIKNLLDCGVLQELQDTKKLAGLAFYAIQSDSKNKIAILDLILDRGANIESLNFSFDSLLQTAIETEQGEIVKHLLAKGADINTVKIDNRTYALTEVW